VSAASVDRDRHRGAPRHHHDDATDHDDDHDDDDNNHHDDDTHDDTPDDHDHDVDGADHDDELHHRALRTGADPDSGSRQPSADAARAVRAQSLCTQPVRAVRTAGVSAAPATPVLIPVSPKGHRGTSQWGSRFPGGERSTICP
jgi:hypothetical protein